MSSQEELQQAEPVNKLIDFLTASPWFTVESCLLVLELLRRKVVCLNPAFKLFPDDNNEVQADIAPTPVKEWNELAVERALRKLRELSSEIERKATDQPARLLPRRMIGAVDQRSIEEIVLRIQETPAALAVDPLEMIAAIICETYAEAGEDALIADDEALLMIRDLLLDNDRESIERNRGKCIAARVRSWDALSR